MHKLLKIVGYTVASAGIEYATKKIVDHKKCHCGCHEINVEEEEPTNKTESHKTKEEKRTGSRYGSNPVKY